MTPDSISPERIMQLAWGFAPPLILEVAIRNRVFDFLDIAPHTVEEVAESVKGSARGWRAVLNSLVGLGLLAKESLRYTTTQESSMFLVTTKPSYMGGFLKHISERAQWGQSTNLDKPRGGRTTGLSTERCQSNQSR
jgi:hypothetical protein